MNEVLDKLDIDFCHLNNEGCLKFTFNEHFKEEDAVYAVEEWKELQASSKGGKINIIWNCLNMKSYERKTLSVWQKTLKTFKNKIEDIWLITDSKKIKAGAVLMSTFSSLKIKVVKTEDKICYN